MPSVNEDKPKSYEDGLRKLHFEFDFKISMPFRFQYFCDFQTELDIFTMPFNVNCRAVRPDFQLELTETQSKNHPK